MTETELDLGVDRLLRDLAPQVRRRRPAVPRQAVGRTGETRPGRLPALLGAGYFFVWTVFGMAAFPLGVALAAVEMQQPALSRAHGERPSPLATSSAFCQPAGRKLRSRPAIPSYVRFTNPPTLRRLSSIRAS